MSLESYARMLRETHKPLPMYPYLPSNRIKELEAQVADLNEADKMCHSYIDHLRADRSASRRLVRKLEEELETSHKCVDELTVEVERLREGWMKADCEVRALAMLNYSEGFRSCYDGCSYRQAGTYCKAVRKAVEV